MSRYEITKINKPDKEILKNKIDLAKKNGFNGLILLKKPNNKFKKYKKNINKIKTKLDLVKGIELNQNKIKNLKSKIAKYRPKADFLAINGGKEKINRFALEEKRIDLLYNYNKPSNRGINHIYAKLAKKNEIGLGFNLKKLLINKGYLRARLLRNQIKNKEIIEKIEAPIVLSTFSENKYQIKKDRELKNLIKVIGFEGKKIRDSYEFLKERIKENRKSQKPNFVEPGVEIVENSSSNP